MKWIKNISGETKNYHNHDILDGEFYLIPQNLMAEYQSSSSLVNDLSTGDTRMSSDGVTPVSTIGISNVYFLLGVPSNPTDSSGAAIQRTKVTESGWRYDPRSLDWVTSKRASLYNRKPTGFSVTDQTDIGDAVIRFWDSAGAELIQGGAESDVDFQTRLGTDCTATAVEWQPTYDMDVIGATITIRSAPTTDAYLWSIVAPDIPEAYGGRLTFGSGGFNLSHFNNNDKLEINGRGVKTIYFDPVYNSNKFQFLCVHAAGAQIGIQFFFEHYHG